MQHAFARVDGDARIARRGGADGLRHEVKTARPIVWLMVWLFCYALLPVDAAPTEQPSITPGYCAVLRDGDFQKLREAIAHGASAHVRAARGNTHRPNSGRAKFNPAVFFHASVVCN